MVALRNAFSDLLAPGLSEVVALAYKAQPEEYSKIFTMKGSKRKYETTTTVEGLGIAAVKQEGVGIEYKDLTQGYDETFTHNTYGLGFRVSREMYDDDLYGVMEDAAKYLGRSIKLAIENAAASIFNYGWTASAAYYGADGVELFSRVHPWASGGTYANELSAAADLSTTSLQAALSDIEGTTDSTGVPIALIAKTLLVPPELRWDASVILESQKKSGTANNDKNVFLDLDLSYMVNHYLTGDDDSFLLCDYNGLKGWMRQKPQFENDDDFDTGDAKFKVTSRHSFGWSDPIGVFGILGA